MVYIWTENLKPYSRNLSIYLPIKLINCTWSDFPFQQIGNNKIRKRDIYYTKIIKNIKIIMKTTKVPADSVYSTMTSVHGVDPHNGGGNSEDPTNIPPSIEVS